MLFVVSALGEGETFIEEIDIIYKGGDKSDVVSSIGDGELVVGTMLDPETDHSQLVLILNLIHE